MSSTTNNEQSMSSTTNTKQNTKAGSFLYQLLTFDSSKEETHGFLRCKFCVKSFDNPYLLQYHIIIEHPTERPSIFKEFFTAN